jgi:hypothetical protein
MELAKTGALLRSIGGCGYGVCSVPVAWTGTLQSRAKVVDVDGPRLAIPHGRLGERAHVLYELS